MPTLNFQQPTTDFRIAVIGGGISGLAAAHRLIELAAAAPAAARVTLFEAGPRLGGVIRTEKIDDCTVELGSDSFITSKPEALELCRRLGLESRLIGTDPRHRQALVLRKGKPVTVPDGFMLMAPAKIWPVLTSPIFSPLGKLRLGLECLVPRRKAATDESVAAFVRRRLGREALDRLVQPLVAGIYTSDPEKLSLQATLPRFIEMEARAGSLILAARRQSRANGWTNSGDSNPESGARYGLFLSLRDGMQELVDTLVRRIEEQGEVRLNTRVVEIRQSNESGAIALSFARDGGPVETTSFDAVVVALPARIAAPLLKPIDAALSKSLAAIEYASSAIVVTGHDLAQVAHPLKASGLVVPAVERRQILSVSFASQKFAGRAPQGRTVLRTFLGGALQPEIIHKSDDELLRIVKTELADILGVRGEPRFAVVSRHEQAMPQYHVGHLSRVAEIERLLSAHSTLALAGNAFTGVGIPDCIRSGERAMERIFQTVVRRQKVA